MATTVVNNFDVYNTTNYWLGYSIPGYTVEQNITQIYYSTQFSSNIIGSQIDFFNSLAGNPISNPNFNSVGITLDDLPYLWKNYWWEEGIYYSHPIVKSNIFSVAPDYFQLFSESVGSLYFIAKNNNFSNTETVPFNTIISSLLVPGVSGIVASFYQSANNLFINNIQNIGPGTGTDITPNNEALIMADTDLERRISSNTVLAETVNELYPKIKDFLPINTDVIGNLIAPYSWRISANNEFTNINVDFINDNLENLQQLTVSTLITE